MATILDRAAMENFFHWRKVFMDNGAAEYGFFFMAEQSWGSSRHPDDEFSGRTSAALDQGLDKDFSILPRYLLCISVRNTRVSSLCFSDVEAYCFRKS